MNFYIVTYEDADGQICERESVLAKDLATAAFNAQKALDARPASAGLEITLVELAV